MDILVIGDTRGEVRYVRPRVPSKAHGRCGTRRQWKRDNPPGEYLVVATHQSL